MKIKLFSLLAGTALLGSVAVAQASEPVTLTDAQMDGVTAGLLDNNNIAAQIAAAIQASAPITANTVASVGILAENVQATGFAWVNSQNTAIFRQRASQR